MKAKEEPTGSGVVGWRHPHGGKKLEIRNPKLETNSNFRNGKSKTRNRIWFWTFAFGSFEIVSDFVFRISDFLDSVPRLHHRTTHLITPVDFHCKFLRVARS